MSAGSGGTPDTSEPPCRPRKGDHVIVRLRGAHNANDQRAGGTPDRRESAGERSETGGHPKAALAVEWACAANDGRADPLPKPPRGTRGKRRGAGREKRPKRATGREAPVC